MRQNPTARKNLSLKPPSRLARSDGAVNDGSAKSGVTLKGVTKSFGNVRAISSIDLQISTHTSVGIVGPSGGGKSTLLLMVAGLLEPDAGTIHVDGATTRSDRLRHCAMMPQRDLLLPWRTALDNASIALQNRGVSRREARKQVQPLFEHFGLSKFEEARPSQLSGGMRQRVSFLRTLIAGKDVLLLDEPFGALDSITRGQMQEWLLFAMNEEPRTVLLVTHDVEEALLLTQRVIVLSHRPGHIVRDLDVNYPRQGSRNQRVTSPEFVAMKEQALEAIDADSI